MQERIFYVYHHINENSEYTETGCRYIGKGKGTRAYFTHNRNRYWNNIFSKNNPPTVVLIAENLTEEEAFEIEKQQIAFAREHGVKLCNMTDGGEGTSGYVCSLENRQKRSNSAKARCTPTWCQKSSDAAKGKVVVQDKDGKGYHVSIDDSRIKSGELVHALKGKVSVRDKNGNTHHVSVNDPRYLSGEFIGVQKGKVSVKDKDGNNLSVFKDDPRYLSGEFVGVSVGKVVVKDKTGKCFQVSADDPRLKTGELCGNRKKSHVFPS